MGVKLEESPFFKAIQIAGKTALVVDREANSLKRLWCALELKFTQRMDKELVVFTPSGEVGSAKVGSGPLVQVIESWDVTNCEASRDTDRRQILNFLAEGDERDGLRVTNGALEVTSNFDKIMTDETKSVTRRRPGGIEFDFEFETDLFEKAADQLSSFSKSVQQSVRQAATLRRVTTYDGGFVVDQLEARGVTVGQFRVFVKRFKHFVDTTDGMYSPECLLCV